ncbi:4'-phosphopantetheinyl transferase superfamily protein [Rossellomorea oryzaecorticis]|uniref:4'-phosphopantetheinyl transferase superfamily protein n=1 Tax=Rossellomorea oryzaecorticis TaxID=1396505 RepID=A0ABU9K3Y4_9BACI
MAELYYFNTEGISMDELNNRGVLKPACPYKKEKYRENPNKKGVAASLLGDVLIRKGISDLTGKRLYDIKLERNKHGKPQLKEGCGLHFNLSHSANYIIAAFSEYRIGVDIERIRNINLKIARNMFTQEEYDYITKTSSDKMKLMHFYQIWTLKESYMKAVGKGLTLPLDSFSVVRGSKVLKELTHEFMLELVPIHLHYQLAVCFNRNDQINKVHFLRL